MATPLHVHQPEAADARSLSDRAYYRIRELIATEPGLTEMRMFGGLAFLVGGHMSVGVSPR